MGRTRDPDFLTNFDCVITAVDHHLYAATTMLSAAAPAEWDADTRGEFGYFAETLKEIAASATRAAALIEKITNDLMAWGRPSSDCIRCRGQSIRDRGHIAAGTTFIVDEIMVGDNGEMFGVVWDDPDQTFEWLSPHDLKSWTRPITDLGKDGCDA